MYIGYDFLHILSVYYRNMPILYYEIIGCNDDELRVRYITPACIVSIFILLAYYKIN